MKRSIPWAKPVISRLEKEYVAEALESSWISGGPFVDRLEREFLRRNGAERGVAVSNGTAALHLALLALGVGPGDEVVVPGFTFVAPGNMALAVGAKPVFADIDSETWCVDPASVEKALSPRTKALIAVHVYGNICDMDALREIASRRKVALVEDAAEAAFSIYQGRCAGTFGDIGCFSFQATKTVATGEGGFVLTSRADLHEKMRIIRDHGMRPGKRYWHDVVGHNFRLTNLQAALGCAQIEQLDARLRARAAVYDGYRRRLSGEAGIVLQVFRPGIQPVVWAVCLRLSPESFPGGRDAVMAALAEDGIETRPGFYPFSVLPMYGCPPLPVSEQVGLNVLSVPSHPELTDEEIGFICGRLLRLRRRP